MHVSSREIIGIFAHVQRAEQHGIRRLEPCDKG